MTKCPQCGYSEIPEIKTHHAAMHTYVNETTGRKAVFNRLEDTIEFKSKDRDEKDVVTTWVREDKIRGPQVNTPYPQQKLQEATKPVTPVAPKIGI